MVYEEQRNWEKALENYRTSLRYYESCAPESPEIEIVKESIRRTEETRS